MIFAPEGCSSEVISNLNMHLLVMFLMVSIAALIVASVCVEINRFSGKTMYLCLVVVSE
jgi:hypothetical protein